MATFTKFQPFVEHQAEGVHNLGSGQLVIALTNSAPTAGMATLSEITEISYTNVSTRNITTSASSQTAGVYKLVLTDLVLTASGAIPTFRYVVVYNDTPTSPADPLIGFFDYGAGGVTIANSGETFTIDFDGTNGLLQVT
jgi:hypothetical protein